MSGSERSVGSATERAMALMAKFEALKNKYMHRSPPRTAATATTASTRSTTATTATTAAAAATTSGRGPWSSARGATAPQQALSQQATSSARGTRTTGFGERRTVAQELFPPSWSSSVRRHDDAQQSRPPITSTLRASQAQFPWEAAATASTVSDSSPRRGATTEEEDQEDQEEEEDEGDGGTETEEQEGQEMRDTAQRHTDLQQHHSWRARDEFSRPEEDAETRESNETSDSDEYMTADDDSADSVATYSIETDAHSFHERFGDTMQTPPPRSVDTSPQRPRLTASTRKSPTRVPRRPRDNEEHAISDQQGDWPESVNVTVWERECERKPASTSPSRPRVERQLWSQQNSSTADDTGLGSTLPTMRKGEPYLLARAHHASHAPRRKPTQQQRERAATVIQAAWRGFVIRATDPDVAAVRREIRTRRMEDHIVSLHRQLDTLRAELVREQELRAMQQEAMRAIWDKARVLAGSVNHMQQREQTRAAIVLQKHIRAWLARKRYSRELHDRLRNNMTMMARSRAAIVGGDDHALREAVLQLQDQMYALKTSLDRAMMRTAWGHARNRQHHGQQQQQQQQQQLRGLLNETM
ncbi:hypothetical protein PTSG_04751 [Salpingoeca rosetta]|uniref:Uncharacterized protein n=1 Tax=Salpingoeca rosetta (strain ATCC 50818 / BSB-021) TaxID=946362 RepID=F2U9L3_SALR5|nr:uncharacterized protein PTSG_04751 [Salpingoeca rosetta]EGD73040.1 hypothetical protein PTSG_04751 [Salpingoeca rosetta]|eukprot:XP_004994071.1 hypothetical protein PTSG_04751 [Salpingoeca rosetta]